MTITPAAILASLSGDIENFFAATTPGGIEQQEAQGQQSFVNSTTLPKDFLENSRAELESAGVKFGDDVDEIFINAELPAGWKKIPTSHSMWSYLVDDKGRVRAAIFYKAAFYDRNAHISTVRRFDCDGYRACDADGNPVENRDSGYLSTVITDSGKAIHTIGMRAESEYEKGREHAKQAVAWLDENYPDHKNASAYWD